MLEVSPKGMPLSHQKHRRSHPPRWWRANIVSYLRLRRRIYA